MPFSLSNTFRHLLSFQYRECRAFPTFKPDLQPLSPLQLSTSTPQHQEQTQAHGQASSCLLDAAQWSRGLFTPVGTQKETYTKRAFICSCADMTQGESNSTSSTALSCHVYNAMKGSPFPPLGLCHCWQESQCVHTKEMHMGYGICSPVPDPAAPGALWVPLGLFSLLAFVHWYPFSISGERSHGYKRPGANYE